MSNDNDNDNDNDNVVDDDDNGFIINFNHRACHSSFT